MASVPTKAVDDKTLRIFLFSTSKALSREKWVIFYERKHSNQANNLSQTLDQAFQKLNLCVDDLSQIRIDHADDTLAPHSNLRRNLQQKETTQFLSCLKTSTSTEISIYYATSTGLFLGVCYQNFGEATNMLVGLNVLRKNNSKLGGDFNLKFSREILPIPYDWHQSF